MHLPSNRFDSYSSLYVSAGVVKRYTQRSLKPPSGQDLWVRIPPPAPNTNSLLLNTSPSQYLLATSARYALTKIDYVLINSNKRLLYYECMKMEAATMNCTTCKVECRRFGKHRNGLQRFRCPDCGKTYTEAHERPLGDMLIPIDKAVLALQLLLEGSSVRTTERTLAFTAIRS